MNITIAVGNRVATRTGGGHIPCGATDSTVTFTFDGEWSAAPARTARFSYLQKDGWHYRDVAFTGVTASIPALPSIDYVLIGVYAGALQTGTPARVPCDAGGGEDIPTPDNDGYYMPFVQADGDLVWSASRDELPGVPTVNIMGPRGETGAQGPQGKTGAQGERGETGQTGAAGYCLYPCGTTAPTQTGMTSTVPIFAFHLPGGTALRVGDTALCTDGWLATVQAISGSNVTIKGTGLCIRGAAGFTPVRGADYWTQADREAIVADTVSALPTETWTFELADGTTVQKVVVTA